MSLPTPVIAAVPQGFPQAWDPAAGLTRSFPEPVSSGAGVRMGPGEETCPRERSQAQRPAFDGSASQGARDLLFSTKPHPYSRSHGVFP